MLFLKHHGASDKAIVVRGGGGGAVGALVANTERIHLDRCLSML